MRHISLLSIVVAGAIAALTSLPAPALGASINPAVRQGRSSFETISQSTARVHSRAKYLRQRSDSARHAADAIAHDRVATAEGGGLAAAGTGVASGGTGPGRIFRGESQVRSGPHRSSVDAARLRSEEGTAVADGQRDFALAGGASENAAAARGEALEAETRSHAADGARAGAGQRGASAVAGGRAARGRAEALAGQGGAADARAVADAKDASIDGAQAEAARRVAGVKDAAGGELRAEEKEALSRDDSGVAGELAKNRAVGARGAEHAAITRERGDAERAAGERERARRLARGAGDSEARADTDALRARAERADADSKAYGIAEDDLGKAGVPGATGDAAANPAEATRRTVQDEARLAALESRVKRDESETRKDKVEQHDAAGLAKREALSAEDDRDQARDDTERAEHDKDDVGEERERANAASARAEADRARVEHAKVNEREAKDKVESEKEQLGRDMSREVEAKSKTDAAQRDVEQAQKQTEATVTVESKVKEKAEAVGNGSDSGSSGGGSGSGEGEAEKRVKQDDEKRRLEMTAEKLEDKGTGNEATEQEAEERFRREKEDLERETERATHDKREVERAKDQLEAEERAVQSAETQLGKDVADEDRAKEQEKKLDSEATDLEGKATDLEGQARDHDAAADDERSREMQAEDHAREAEEAEDHDRSELSEVEEEVKRDRENEARERAAQTEAGKEGDALKRQQNAEESGAESADEAARSESDEGDSTEDEASEARRAADEDDEAARAEREKARVADENVKRAEEWVKESEAKQDALRERLRRLDAAAEAEEGEARELTEDEKAKRAERDEHRRKLREELDKGEASHKKAAAALTSMKDAQAKRRAAAGEASDDKVEAATNEAGVSRGVRDAAARTGDTAQLAGEGATSLEAAGAASGSEAEAVASGSVDAAEEDTEGVEEAGSTEEDAAANLDAQWNEARAAQERAQGADTAPGPAPVSTHGGAQHTAPGPAAPAGPSYGQTTAPPAVDSGAINSASMTPVTSDTAASASSGHWVIPPDVLQAANGAPAVRYDDAPAWSGQSGCSGSFTSGAASLKAFVMSKFQGVSSIGGYSCRQNTANKAKTSVHGSGRALDIMIRVVGGKANSQVGDPIANYLVANAAKIGVQYVIWDRWSWSQSRKRSKRYGGPNPHIDHLHVEINREAAAKNGVWWESGSSTSTSTTPGGQTSTTPSSPVNVPDGAQILTPQEIACSFGCPVSTATQYAKMLNAALRSAQVTTWNRVTMFAAQIGHESAGLTAMTERGGNCRRYEGSRNLGNTQSGDGCRYKGRGPIQLTGRWNYNACGKAIGQDLISKPELAANPAIGFQTTVWFWNFKKLNPYADRGDMNGATKRINGGDNGITDRRNRYAKAKQCIPQANFERRLQQASGGNQQQQTTNGPASPPAVTVDADCDLGSQSKYNCGDAFEAGRNVGPRECVKVQGKDVTTAMYCPLMKLARAMQGAGVPFKLNSGFRTNAKQTYFWNCYRNRNCNNGNLAARPGTSKHQNGQAVDLNTHGGAYEWLRNNASRYGFIRTVSSEKWHWEHRPGQRCNARVSYSCR